MAHQPNRLQRRLAAMALFAMVAVLVPTARSLADGEYLLLSVWSGAPGSEVSVEGFGFEPGASVNVVFQGASKDVTADAGGGFKTPAFTVPLRPGGSYPIIATATGESATAKFYIEGRFPSALPTDWWVAPGQSFGIIATSFAPGETISIFLGDNGQPYKTVQADSNGDVNTTNTIKAPAAFAGKSMQVRLVGEESGASASFAVTVGGFYVHASPTAYYATPGQTIGVTGGGFAPDETVNLLSNNNLVAALKADDMGNIDAPEVLTITFGASGARTFRVLGLESNGSAEFTVEIGGLFAHAKPTEYFALPGQFVGVIAGGFLPGETVKLETEKGVLVATATADSKGDVPGWAQIIKVPFGKAGDLTYRVIGETSNASTSLGFSVGGFDPQLNPSSWYVAPRKIVQGNGSGFAPGETVQIAVNGATVKQVIANAEGNFVVSVRAPASGTSFTFTATGSESGGVAERTIGMNVACEVEEEEA